MAGAVPGTDDVRVGWTGIREVINVVGVVGTGHTVVKTDLTGND